LIARWRWPALVVSIVVALISATPARRLEFSNDYRVFFSKRNPQLTAFEEIERIYTKNDTLLFVLKPATGSVFTREVLALVKGLTEAGWQIPHSIRVDSITNFQHTRAREDFLVVGDLVAEPEQLRPAELEEIRAVAIGEPLLRNRLISADGSTTGVNVRLQVPGQSQTEIPEAVDSARRLLGQLRAQHPDIQVELSGSGMLSNAFAEAPQKDLSLLVPLMYTVLLATMLLLLRSITATLAAVGVVALSALTAMGFAGWMNLKLNGISACAPTIILTLGIANAIHILISLFAEMGGGASQRQALRESLRVNAEPVFLTSLTTVIGFLSLNFSDAPPLQDLGNITAVGIAAAWAYSMVFLPAVIAIVPVRSRRGAAASSAAMARLAEFVIAHRGALLLSMAALAVVLTSFIGRFEINDRPIEYFDESIEFRRAADFAQKHLVGIYGVSFSVSAGESSGINEPQYLRRLEAFAEWFRAQPEVTHVSVITDTLKRLNRNMHGDDPAYYRLPETRNVAAQYLLLYEMSIPYGLDLNDQINVDKSATRVDVTFGDIDFKIVKRLKAEAEQWLREHGLPSMQAEGASPAVMFAYIAERNIYAMLRGTGLAFALISLVLIVALRNLKIGTVSVIPNIVPIGMAFGTWAILFREVGFAVSVVAGVSIGIIVDDTVHFLSKYLRARREKKASSADAVRYAFATVGTALWVTSAILVFGFGALSLSAFWPNATMGMLTALAIAAALAADFLLLPPLLMLLDTKRGGEG
jgi:predicted RND superfamily exporter protein